MIVNNPALYKKVMCAYKSTRREMDKKARETMIKRSLPRDSYGDIKKLPRKEEASIKSLQ